MTPPPGPRYPRTHVRPRHVFFVLSSEWTLDVDEDMPAMCCDGLSGSRLCFPPLSCHVSSRPVRRSLAPAAAAAQFFPANSGLRPRSFASCAVEKGSERKPQMAAARGRSFWRNPRPEPRVGERRGRKGRGGGRGEGGGIRQERQSACFHNSAITLESGFFFFFQQPNCDVPVSVSSVGFSQR